MKTEHKAYEGLNLMRTVREWLDPSFEGNPYKKEARLIESNKPLFSFRIKFGKKFAI